MDDLQKKIIEIYGYGVCDAYSSKHCVGRCECRIDCGARPIPKEEYVFILSEYKNF